MTPNGAAAGGGPTASAGRPRPDRALRRGMLGSLIRAGVVSAFLVSAYAFVPLGRRPEGAVTVQFVLWSLVFLAVVGWEILAVHRSAYPRLRAIEAIAVSVPLFILLFASAYFVTGQVDAGSFNEPLTRIDALYLTVTVFATVGFGDIVATTEAARMLVTLQMLADLVLIGLIAKVLLGVVQRRRRYLDEYPQGPVAPGGTGSPGAG
jgi:voltage-gated potassium channel